MKKTLLFLLIFNLFASFSQSQKLSYKLYGYVDAQFFFNSRKNMESGGSSVNFLPLPERPDENGKDLNAVSSAEIISVASRVGLDVSGINLLNANISAKMEADFCGSSSYYFLLRIRRAFIDMKWEKTSLLFGQEWHPMDACLFPTSFSLNTGAPFNPLNRSPQVSFKYNPGKFRFLAAALYEMQYTSNGPKGRSSEYQKNAVVPEIYVGVENNLENFRYGAGFDVKMIKPRTESSVTIDEEIKTYSVDEKLWSCSGIVYAEYVKNKLRLKAKAIYGQNLTNLSMFGGYGVSKIDEITGEKEYTNFNVLSTWFTVDYGKIWKISLLGSYACNLGTSSSLASGEIYYTFGNLENQMFDRAYKISPQLSYNMPNWMFGLEYDMTTAAYGNLNLKSGKTDDSDDITNHRILAMVRYLF